MTTIPLDATPLPVAIGAGGPVEYIDELLKRPALVARAIEADSELSARTRTYVKVLIACTATFGAALGFYRGGAQILFAAVKLPLVTLVTLAVVAPLLHLLNRALERPANMAREVSTLVAALARGALVLAAETPLIWAAHALGAEYHRLILLTVFSCGIAGRGELLVPVGRPFGDAPVALGRGLGRAHHRRDRGRAGELAVPTVPRTAAGHRRGVHAPTRGLFLGGAG
jgi:hypothetical protein